MDDFRFDEVTVWGYCIPHTVVDVERGHSCELKVGSRNVLNTFFPHRTVPLYFRPIRESLAHPEAQTLPRRPENPCPPPTRRDTDADGDGRDTDAPLTHAPHPTRHSFCFLGVASLSRPTTLLYGEPSGQLGRRVFVQVSCKRGSGCLSSAAWPWAGAAPAPRGRRGSADRACRRGRICTVLVPHEMASEDAIDDRSSILRPILLLGPSVTRTRQGTLPYCVITVGPGSFLNRLCGRGRKCCGPRGIAPVIVGIARPPSAGGHCILPEPAGISPGR